MIERHGQHAALAVAHERAGRPLQPQPLDEGEQRLTGDRTEEAVEVEGREGGDRRQPGDRQVVGQVAADVIDHPVDPLLVRRAVARRRHAPELTARPHASAVVTVASHVENSWSRATL